MSFIRWAAVTALVLAVGPNAFAQTQAQATAQPAGSKAIVAWAAKPDRVEY